MNKPSSIVPGSDEWLEARRKHLCASDAPAVLGVSRFSSPYDVCLSKWGEAPEKEMTEAMARGIILQPAIKKAYEMQNGCLLTPEVFVEHPKHKWMAATPDGTVEGGSKNVQIKTHLHWLEDEYGEAGSDEVPDWEYVQVAHEMAVTDLDSSDLVILFASDESFSVLTHMVSEWWDKGNGEQEKNRESVAQYILNKMDLRTFSVTRNPGIEKDLIEVESEFWNKYVLPRELPPSAPIRLDTGDIRIANEEEARLILTIKNTYRLKCRVEEDWDKLVMKAKEAIGEDSGIDSLDIGKITYKKCKDSVSEVTDWERIARTLFDTLADSGTKPEVLDTLIEVCTEKKVTPGVRRFVYPYKRWRKEA